MPIAVSISAKYRESADALFASALQFSEMAQAMAGFAKYEGLPKDDVAQEGTTFTVDVTFWSLFKQTGHVIFIERIDLKSRIVQSRESGKGIKRWDHTLSVQPDGDLAVWTDTVVIDAGWRTPLVVGFAAFMYRRRHRHRRAVSINCQFGLV